MRINILKIEQYKDIIFSVLGWRKNKIYQSGKKLGNKTIYLLAYWVGNRRKDLNAENMSAAIKFSTTTLNYPSLRWIPIDRVDTHSLRSGGANALSLA